MGTRNVRPCAETPLGHVGVKGSGVFALVRRV